MIFKELNELKYTNIRTLIDTLFYCGLPSNVTRGQLQETFHSFLCNKDNSIPKLCRIFSAPKIEEYLFFKPIARNRAHFTTIFANYGSKDCSFALYLQEWIIVLHLLSRNWLNREIFAQLKNCLIEVLLIEMKNYAFNF
jgi:hypothetical protein